MSDTEIFIGKIKVTVLASDCYVENGKANAECFDFARKIIGDLARAKEFAAKKLLKLYNETWFTEDIGVLTQDAFTKRISLSSITIFDELGAAAVHFLDGDIFGGHYIEIGYAEGEMKHCDIFG